jgi:hypothetical protein
MALVVGPFANITTGADSWSLSRFFTPDMDRVGEATLKRDATGSITIAGTDVDFRANVEATHQVELVWPNDDTDAVTDLSRFGIRINPDEVGVRLRLRGTATARAAAKLPVGSLSLGFGAEGSATLEYERFRPYALSTSIPEALQDIARGLRLPSHVRSVETLPAANELLTTRLSSYLQLSADVAWRASIANTRGVQLGELALASESQLSLAVAAAAKYRLAGDFDIHCCRTGDRVRFVVRKSRESKFSFATDFKLDAEFKTAGLPDTASDFVGKLLGADVARVLGNIDRLQRVDSLDDIKGAVGEWASGALGELSGPLIGKALDNTTTRQFLTALRKITAQYTSLDQRVARLYEEGVDDVPRLRQSLDILAAAQQPDALKAVSDAGAWAIFRRLTGDRLYDTLLDRAEYQEVLTLVARTRDFIDNGSDDLKNVVATLQRTLPFDAAIRRLEQLSSPEALATLADAQLQRAVSLLLDREFGRIRDDAEPAFKRLQQALEAYDAFNAKWYGQLLETANRKFKATVNAEFTRASTSDALIDVAIDVSTPLGQHLAGRAAVGDFAELLADARQPVVTIRDAILTHAVARGSSLKVSALGFDASRITRLITTAKNQFQQTDNGLLLIHTVEAKNEKEVRVRNESTLTRFIFRGTFEGLMPQGDPTRTHMVDTMRAVSTSYQYRIKDAETSAEELVEYLEFARQMGLVASPAAFVADLRTQLPQGWTSVTADYVIGYDVAAVAAVFAQDTATLQVAAQRALSTLIGQVLIVHGKPNDARMGLAYLNRAVRDAYERAVPDVPPGVIGVVVPAWVTHDRQRTEALTREQKQLLRGVLNTEARYLNRLAQLDRLMDKLLQNPAGVRTAVLSAELDDVVTDFVAMADDFPTDKKINPFFGAFDALIATYAPRARRAALVLEITPAGGGDAVTKYLS